LERSNGATRPRWSTSMCAVADTACGLSIFLALSEGRAGAPISLAACPVA
jgi:hypothetical protein